VVWAQEEPGNQGAWHRIQHYLKRGMRADQTLTNALRPSSASPAVGYLAKSNEQQKALVESALSWESKSEDALNKTAPLKTVATVAKK
jgi:2-oxoglutarate dehydrogenase E1 component